MGLVCLKVFLLLLFFYGKSVMSMFCNVMMLLLSYVHVCITRTGWKTKTVILSIKKSNQIKSLTNPRSSRYELIKAHSLLADCFP